MRVQKVSDPLDQMIGRNIRFHRIRRRLSQIALAKRNGVAYQQIQKYENATSRIPASRLVQIARMLDVPVTALLGDGEEALIGGTEDRALRRCRRRLMLGAAKITDRRLLNLAMEMIECMARLPSH
jgi:transcriptional regulator with XRE-family HTH domain